MIPRTSDPTADSTALAQPTTAVAGKPANGRSYHGNEQLNGLIERVTIHSEESGFCVLQVKVRGCRDLATVIGTLPQVHASEWVPEKKSPQSAPISVTDRSREPPWWARIPFQDLLSQEQEKLQKLRERWFDMSEQEQQDAMNALQRRFGK